jgi:hypothetical protein
MDNMPRFVTALLVRLIFTASSGGVAAKGEGGQSFRWRRHLACSGLSGCAETSAEGSADLLWRCLATTCHDFLILVALGPDLTPLIPLTTPADQVANFGKNGPFGRIE